MPPTRPPSSEHAAENPIVETPEDAVNCFLTTGIDHLVIHDTVVSKAAMHKVVAPLVNVYADVRTLVASTARPA